MKSNYKKLGSYIRTVDERNTDLAITNLQGVSITKEFVPSIANIIGTDLSTYKIVRTGQFAYGPVTSRNGDKVSIALLKDEDCIISSSYVPFEVYKPDELLPEYLMLWFMRPEFDRYARFMSNGSAREVFDWNCMCDVELPIPSITEQNKIVHDFTVITGRISILRRMNENLVSQACTILATHVGVPVLVNKSNSEIEKLSQKQSICTIKQYCKSMSTGSTPSRSEIGYWYDGSVPWLKSGEVHNCCIYEVEEKITELALQKTSVKMLKAGTVVMAMYGATAAQVGYLCIDTTTNQAICGMECSNPGRAAYLYFSLIFSQDEIFKQANGGAQNNLSKEMIEKFNIVDLSDTEIRAFGLEALLRMIGNNTSEIGKLKKLNEMIIARMWKGGQP
jgi:restriction endonuclease S subunit